MESGQFGLELQERFLSCISLCGVHLKHSWTLLQTESLLHITTLHCSFSVCITHPNDTIRKWTVVCSFSIHLILRYFEIKRTLFKGYFQYGKSSLWEKWAILDFNISSYWKMELKMKGFFFSFSLSQHVLYILCMIKKWILSNELVPLSFWDKGTGQSFVKERGWTMQEECSRVLVILWTAALKQLLRSF